MACLLATTVLALSAVPLPGGDRVAVVSTAQAWPTIPEVELVCYLDVGGDDLVRVGCNN